MIVFYRSEISYWWLFQLPGNWRTTKKCAPYFRGNTEFPIYLLLTYFLPIKSHKTYKKSITKFRLLSAVATVDRNLCHAYDHKRARGLKIWLPASFGPNWCPAYSEFWNSGSYWFSPCKDFWDCVKERFLWPKNGLSCSKGTI
jgi:hypothetical protein